MKIKKPYIVRGFNILDGQFDCKGVIEEQVPFFEVTVDSSVKAVVEMTTHSDLSAMSSRFMLTSADLKFSNTTFTDVNEVVELHTINLCISTDALETADLRPYKSDIRAALKHWTEKCRIKGLRGWRLSAVKTPTFEKVGGVVIIRTNIILGTTIFYDHATRSYYDPTDGNLVRTDLVNLKKHLAKGLPVFRKMVVRHSEEGLIEL